MAKSSLYPFPVYVATLANGETARLSFFSPQGKPFDFARGRAAVKACWSRPEGAPCIGTYPPAVVIDGHVEWNGARHDDPYFNAAATVAKTAKTNWRELAARARVALAAGDATAALELLKAA
jgi:hypothetical protein